MAAKREYMHPTPRGATKAVLDLVENGVTNPIELAELTGKSRKAIDTLCRRHGVIEKIDNLPHSKSELRKMEKEIKKKVRSQIAKAIEVTNTEPSKAEPAKGSDYYAVMTTAYRRVIKHVEELRARSLSPAEIVAQLLVDFEEAAVITAAKAKAETGLIKELVE